jgi:DNA-binding NarL/FixJ family response regulator
VTPSTGPLRVAIVEDDRRSREGLALLIGGTPGYSCVGSFDSVEGALGATIAPPPDVLLLDIDLPGMSGSEGVRVIQRQWLSTQILMLTVYAERDHVFESICNGACGYMLKQTPPARLLEAIREAHDGGAPMSPEIARQVVTLFRRTAPAMAGTPLTPQEVRLLGLLAEGYSYLAAGGQLNISVNTVRNYIRTIYDKLHVHSKSEAVSQAIRKGIIQ